jgi:DNA mismatch repair ATPase MutS
MTLRKETSCNAASTKPIEAEYEQRLSQLQANVSSSRSRAFLALFEIAEIAGLRGMNYHRESENPEDPLKFDYKVKAGISSQSNALAVLEMIGIPRYPPNRTNGKR